MTNNIFAIETETTNGKFEMGLSGFYTQAEAQEMIDYCNRRNAEDGFLTPSKRVVEVTLEAFYANKQAWQERYELEN